MCRMIVANLSGNVRVQVLVEQSRVTLISRPGAMKSGQPLRGRRPRPLRWLVGRRVAASRGRWRFLRLIAEVKGNRENRSCEENDREG
jgi:hypothetical protein